MPGKCSQERLTRGTVTSTTRRAAHVSGCARCGAGAGCSAINYKSHCSAIHYKSQASQTRRRSANADAPSSAQPSPLPPSLRSRPNAGFVFLHFSLGDSEIGANGSKSRLQFRKPDSRFGPLEERNADAALVPRGEVSIFI